MHSSTVNCCPGELAGSRVDTGVGVVIVVGDCCVLVINMEGVSTLAEVVELDMF